MPDELFRYEDVERLLRVVILSSSLENEIVKEYRMRTV